MNSPASDFLSLSSGRKPFCWSQLREQHWVPPLRAQWACAGSYGSEEGRRTVRAVQTCENLNFQPSFSRMLGQSQLQPRDPIPLPGVGQRCAHLHLSRAPVAPPRPRPLLPPG